MVHLMDTRQMTIGLKLLRGWKGSKGHFSLKISEFTYLTCNSDLLLIQYYLEFTTFELL
jgi:hypothetical protein